jgi:hypothetical protein
MRSNWLAKGWRRLCPPPPPTTRERFPVKSLKQLGFFVKHQRRYFYLLYPRGGGPPDPVSLWPREHGVLVGHELGGGQRHVAYHDPGSFLGRAIAERRLYVLWDV